MYTSFSPGQVHGRQHGIQQLARRADKQQACLSSCSPGASPTTIQRACRWPVPGTACLRPWQYPGLAVVDGVGQNVPGPCRPPHRAATGAGVKTEDWLLLRGAHPARDGLRAGRALGRSAGSGGRMRPIVGVRLCGWWLLAVGLRLGGPTSGSRPSLAAWPAGVRPGAGCAKGWRWAWSWSVGWFSRGAGGGRDHRHGCAGVQVGAHHQRIFTLAVACGGSTVCAPPCAGSQNPGTAPGPVCCCCALPATAIGLQFGRALATGPCSISLCPALAAVGGATAMLSRCTSSSTCMAQ